MWHGHATGGKLSPEYVSFREMHKRCSRPAHNRYHRYGGRGIKVCPQWCGLYGFVTFLKDMPPRPEGMSLDRINTDGDYSPENCKWSSPAEQNRNRSTTRFITYEGVTRTLKEWATLLGIERRTLSARLNQYGWSLEKAFTTPVRSY